MNIFVFFIRIAVVIWIGVEYYRLLKKYVKRSDQYYKELCSHQETLELLKHYKREAEKYEKKYINAAMRPYVSNVYSQEILEAVKYARIKSHPDNGGTMDDFVKFNECYNKLVNSARK